MSPSQHCALVFALVVVSTVGCRQRSDTRPSRPPPDSVSDGYSERPKEEVGGAPSVAFRDGSKKKVARVEELLEGIAGVQVQRTGDGGYSVSIRGVGSMTGNEQPLYVIDGLPYEPGPGGRGLGWLDPEDVLRISVLKNPSETSIYGMRGANGVIVITTKRKR